MSLMQNKISQRGDSYMKGSRSLLRRHLSFAIPALVSVLSSSPRLATAADTESMQDLELEIQKLQLQLKIKELQEQLDNKKDAPPTSIAEAEASRESALAFKIKYTKDRFPQTNDMDLKWLAEKAAAGNGIKQTPQGVLYKVLKKGDGIKFPLLNTPCDCHYRGWTIENYEKAVDRLQRGTPLEAQSDLTLDSSYSRGSTTQFAPNQVIQGWTEALQFMSQGEKWELYIPADNAYGKRGAGRGIPGGAVLIFQIELVNVNGL